MVFPTNEQMRAVIDQSYADMKKRLWENIATRPLGYPWIAGVDPAKPGSDRTVEWSIAQDPCNFEARVIPRQSEPDRIWDLIVLAAESSRYG